MSGNKSVAALSCQLTQDIYFPHILHDRFHSLEMINTKSIIELSDFHIHRKHLTSSFLSAPQLNEVRGRLKLKALIGCLCSNCWLIIVDTQTFPFYCGKINYTKFDNPPPWRYFLQDTAQTLLAAVRRNVTTKR